MQGDDPPYLPVGTAVSAKYKGAFCEAKVSKVVRVVKCKVTYKMGLGTATVTDDQIKGPLRVGQLVQAKHMDKKEYVDATVMKIQDCSQYTVVFDDGDITTLRRTALCLKSGRHFNESETLDQLPLTHPEHFGNPVMGGRRGRRNRQTNFRDDSSEGEVEEENEPDLEAYIIEVGRVVCVEASDKKRNKDNWFPGLVVMPSAQPTVRINVKDEFLVRSFKDGRYYTVPQKEVTDFNREMTSKIESALLAESVEKVLRYLDNDELPIHWERSLLFNNSMQTASSESDEQFTDSSDDETPEEKDHFVAQLYKFMDDSNTPLNKSPMIGTKDVDLHRLFRAVRKLGGYNRVTNKSKWRSVTLRLKLPNNLSTHNQVKLVYKKCLLSFEAFHRTLGVTMLNHPRNAKKSRGRSLIRDKDRSTPVNSPRPDKEEEMGLPEKKEEEKVVVVEEKKPAVVKKPESKPKTDEERVKVKETTVEISDTNSSDAAEQFEASTSVVAGRSRRADSVKSSRERKVKPAVGEKVKALVEKFEEQIKKDEKEEDKTQQTRSKTQAAPKLKEKEAPQPEKKARESKSPVRETPSPNKTPTKPVKKVEEDKKRGRKRTNLDEKEKVSLSDSSTTDSSLTTAVVGIGDKLKVYYGPTHESKVTYEAKVIEIDKEAVNPMYLVHYTGWNTRYDEWITQARIAENLSATTKAKKLKQGAAGSLKGGSTPKSTTKRGRRMSITGRSTAQEAPPRSTTPSSVTSTSSRTKSPGTPATRSYRTTRQGELNRRTRRTSAQTDISNHSESDSDGTESDSDMVRTRSGIKAEEGVFKRKLMKPMLKAEKRKEKEDEETEKEEELMVTEKPKRTRRVKKTPESKLVGESDEDSGSLPKGRDFDLNQIRSELKGFVKALKVTSTDTSEKETLSSDESVTLADAKQSSEPEEPSDPVVQQQKPSNSDDIYEFKEPEPFELTKLVDEKNKKRLLAPRTFEEVDKSPTKKRKPSSPAKAEPKEEVVIEIEKKRLRRTPVKKAEPVLDIEDEEEEDDDDDDDTSDEQLSKRLVVEDPFDKLVESPSFHSGREKVAASVPAEDKQKVVKALNLDGPLSLFRALPETNEDDLDISDTEESQNEPLFTHAEQLFSEATFAKTSPDRAALDTIFKGFMPKMGDRKQKDSDDEDAIRASIQSVINQTSSSTDDDDDDDDSDNVPLVVAQPFKCFQDKSEGKIHAGTSAESEDNPKPLSSEVVVAKPEPKEAKLASTSAEGPPQTPTGPKQISPALQETDSALLEAAMRTQSEILTKLDETKEMNVKTGGTKIADSLLQKFSMIKGSASASPPEIKHLRQEPSDEEVAKAAIESNPLPILVHKEEAKNVEPKPKAAAVAEAKQQPQQPEQKPKPELIRTKPVEVKSKAAESRFKIAEMKQKLRATPTKARDTVPVAIIPEVKKRARKIVSREFIEESDTDSTDSEERLVIARSDEESQTNSSSSSDAKSEDCLKDTATTSCEPSLPGTGGADDEDGARTVAAQSECSFKFDPVKKEAPDSIKIEVKVEIEAASREEEADSHLHSLLLCEETIPGSPAPAPEGPPVPSDMKLKQKSSLLEMPFASAPGSSNNNNKPEATGPRENKAQLGKERAAIVQPPPLPLAVPMDNREKEAREASTVLDNTPPTTPESTLSNLSPRGDPGDLSPNTGDNDSCKSGDADGDYSHLQRRGSSTKASPYSEDGSLDALLNAAESGASNKKTLQEGGSLVLASPCRKRRRSCKGPDDVPMKRGRKPANRSRHNSDSDDMSEHSMSGTLPLGSAIASLETRLARSPKPSKYNFYVELDPTLDSAQRIAILQQKLQEIRKTYADVKAELAAVERRRKKLRRREREGVFADVITMILVSIYIKWNCAMMGLQGTTGKRKLEAAVAAPGEPSPAKSGRWEAQDCIARLQAVAVPGDTWRSPTPAPSSLAASLLTDDFDDEDDFEDELSDDDRDRCPGAPEPARYPQYHHPRYPPDYWQYYQPPQQQTIRCEENGKSYLELGAVPPPPQRTPRCCDGRTRWCHIPCYRQRRLAVLNLSMCKLARYRQCSDPSLRRSVLICNTLRRLEREMETDPPEPPTYGNGHHHHHLPSLPELPPPSRISAVAPSEPSYEQTLREMTCASGRATPFPSAPPPDADSGIGDDEMTRPINWGSVLSLTAQTDLEPLNNNELYAELGLSVGGGGDAMATTAAMMQEWKDPSATVASSRSSSTDDWDGFMHVLVGGS